MVKALYKKMIPLRVRNAIIEFLRKSNQSKYSGDDKQCLICNRSFSHMRPKANRLNAECPNCGSLERTRLLHLYLRDETRVLKEQLHVLHFAPEKSLSRLLRKDNSNYIDCDIDPNLASVKVDITDIQFEDDTFDHIICSHVLAHVKDEEKGIQEMYRVLKPKGTAIIMTQINDIDITFEKDNVNTPQEKLAAYGQDDLYRRHGRDFLSRLSKNDDIRVTKVDFREHFSKEENDKYCLGDGSREILFICTKSQK